MMQAVDVRIAGVGVVGKSLALALSRLGLSVALQGESAAATKPDDVRAYALNAASVALLRELKVWQSLPEGATTPVYEMRVHGDAAGAALEFSAWQQRSAELAVITDAAALEQALDAALAFAPHVERAGGDVAATLVAHCEGRAAATLQALDAGFETQSHGQRAIAARVVATHRHRGVAKQWFRSPDVLALLPLDRPETGRSYGLVWSLPEERAQALLADSEEAFERELASAVNDPSQIGIDSPSHLALASPRASWPLISGQAARWCGPGWVLAGDAAHVVHPLAGQGLNLGLADVAALARVIAEREPWRELGDERLLRRYARQRAAPTWAMLSITDGLLRMFAAESVPLRELRNNGLTLVNRALPLKRWLAARALDSRGSP